MATPARCSRTSSGGLCSRRFPGRRQQGDPCHGHGHRQQVEARPAHLARDPRTAPPPRWICGDRPQGTRGGWSMRRPIRCHPARALPGPLGRPPRCRARSQRHGAHRSPGSCRGLPGRASAGVPRDRPASCHATSSRPASRGGHLPGRGNPHRQLPHGPRREEAGRGGSPMGPHQGSLVLW